MIVAIDGPSGTGKSTVAKRVTEALGFVYFNTGAMYRCLALFLSEQGIDIEDIDQVKKALSSFVFDIKKRDNDDRYLVNGEDVTEQLYQEKISRLASLISAHQEVRTHLLPVQRSFGESHDAVFEGRDIGTVVFPHAELKIFLTARPEVRAQRRTDQLVEKYPDVKHDYAKILEEIEARDERDTTRAVAPLKKADDATIVDTSDMSIDEVVSKIVELAS